MSEVDWLSEKGASVLADRIHSYWLRRGHDVKVWVELAEEARRDVIKNGHGTYAVRSNLVNGLPPKMLEARHYNRVIHAV